MNEPSEQMISIIKREKVGRFIITTTKNVFVY